MRAVIWRLPALSSRRGVDSAHIPRLAGIFFVLLSRRAYSPLPPPWCPSIFFPVLRVTMKDSDKNLDL